MQIVNPTKAQFDMLLKRALFGQLRAVIGSDGTIVIGEAETELHWEMAKSNGIQHYTGIVITDGGDHLLITADRQALSGAPLGWRDFKCAHHWECCDMSGARSFHTP